MERDLRISDFSEVTVSFGVTPIEGWADGDVLSVTFDSDAFGDTVGVTGTVARWPTNDRRADISLRLMQTSPVNAILSGIYKADINAPGGAGIAQFSIFDLNGTSIYVAANAWIKRPPDPTWSNEAREREWILRAANLEDFTGGTL